MASALVAPPQLEEPALRLLEDILPGDTERLSAILVTLYALVAVYWIWYGLRADTGDDQYGSDYMPIFFEPAESSVSCLDPPIVSVPSSSPLLPAPASHRGPVLQQTLREIGKCARHDELGGQQGQERRSPQGQVPGRQSSARTRPTDRLQCQLRTRDTDQVARGQRSQATAIRAQFRKSRAVCPSC